MTKESKTVSVEINDGIMKLQLNRPDSLNAFNAEMIQELKAGLLEAKSNPEVKVVVLSGAGRAFSAGGDIKNMGKRTPVQSYEHIGNLNGLIQLMHDLEKPIIGAVHGYAAGYGFSLALACDIILAAEGTKFIVSFSKVGLVSDGGGIYFLSKLIGLQRTKELYFTAEPLSVEEASSLGIVNHVYSQETFEQEVAEFASKIAAGPSRSYSFIKKLANQSLESSLTELLEQERFSQTLASTTEDHAEGIAAFKEKRNPNFSGN